MNQASGTLYVIATPIGHLGDLTPRAADWLARVDLLLCEDCRKLLNHGIAKLLLCPYDPKPMCKKCETHCYAPGYREKVREVMKFSGMYLIKHGRVDLMVHYML